MTSLPELTFAWDTPTVHTGRVTLAGDLTFVNADALLTAVTKKLTEAQTLTELQVDCASLDLCDSRGLSVLLMLRRSTEAAGVTLRLLNRSPALNRLLDRTGTAPYFTDSQPQASQNSTVH